MSLKLIIKNILLSNRFLKKILVNLYYTYKRLPNFFNTYFHNISKNLSYSFPQPENKNGALILVSRPIAYTFPLSYSYLAGYLVERGVDVKVLFKDKNYHELADEIIQMKPLIVGFGNLYPELKEISDIISILNKKGRNFPIVIGGQMVSPIPEFALKVTGADYGVIGEGEITLYQLFDALRNGKNPKDISGLAIRNGKTITVNGAGEYIKELKDLPQIPYDLFPSSKWLPIGRWYAEHLPEQAHWRYADRVINVHGGRGCPFICNFCYHHNKTRYRDINEMIREADALLKKFDGNMLYFSDDLVLASPKRARKLVDAINNLDRKISYSVSTRFDILERIDDQLLIEMKKSGCRIMGLGVESGSDRILKIIGKNVNSSTILKQLKRLNSVGILPTVSIMVGQYTETEEDVQASIELMRKSILDNPIINYAFTITTPFPGSELYEIAKREKRIKNDADFYKKYFFGKKTGDWNIVVNMSSMSTRKIYKIRDEMDYLQFLFKKEAMGTEKYQKYIQIINEQKALFLTGIDQFELDNKVEKLENEKLEILGIK